MQIREEPRKKTTSATFRIDEGIYEAMQEDAQMKKISVNTLVNQLLYLWADSDRFLAEVGLVRITAPNFKKFLEGIPEDKLAEMGRSASKDLARSYMMAKNGNVSLPGALQYLKGFAQHGGYAKYNEIQTDGKTVIVLMHDFGRAGSLYISAYVESVFELVGSRPKITMSEDSVVVQL